MIFFIEGGYPSRATSPQIATPLDSEPDETQASDVK